MSEIETMITARLNRRRFLSQAGLFGVGVGAAATGLVLGSTTPLHAESYNESKDTVKEIFTAALIAEDLATTFYYNALVGKVIQDPNLSGPGGTATHVTSKGNLGNVYYVRAALTEEISHADLLRSLLGIADAAKDPVQQFYFPSGSFDTLGAFTGLLNALENAFIAAYMTAIQELAGKAALAKQSTQWRDSDGTKYTPPQLEYFAKVAASIMGIECEHRVLGRVISNSNPANNLNYESTDGLDAVYNGAKSAVVALTPFLTPSTGPGYFLDVALNNQGKVSLPVSGGPPKS